MQTTKKKKKKGKNYFNQDTENAIVAFQEAETIKERQEIFVASIQPAFVKLVENIIFVYKFHTLGDIDVLKNDCVSFLFENLDRFDVTKGHKAFSYFNVIAKHWFIQKVKVHKKKVKSNVPFDSTTVSYLESSNDFAIPSQEAEALEGEFFDLLRLEVKKWRDKFDKDQEKTVLEAVILLLENPDLIPIYNKKGIYLYIREITGLNTKQVVTNLTKLKKKYGIFRKRYLEGEF